MDEQVRPDGRQRHHKAAAQSLRGDGVAVRVVDNSMAKLTRVTSRLSDRVATPGTAWAIDPRSDKVLVTVDSTVTNAQQARLERIADRFSGATRIQ